MRRGNIGPPKPSWLSPTGGPVGDHLGMARRRRGPEVFSVNHLNYPWEEDDTYTHDMVAVLLSGTPGFRTVGAAPYHLQEATTGPPLCYMCWTRWHRVPDCKILTDKQRDIVKAARRTFLRQRNGGAGAVPDRTDVVALLWDDLLGGAASTKTEVEDVPPVATPSKGRRGAGNAKGGWPRHPPQPPLSAPAPRLPPVASRLPPRK